MATWSVAITFVNFTTSAFLALCTCDTCFKVVTHSHFKQKMMLSSSVSVLGHDNSSSCNPHISEKLDYFSHSKLQKPVQGHTVGKMLVRGWISRSVLLPSVYPSSSPFKSTHDFFFFQLQMYNVWKGVLDTGD